MSLQLGALRDALKEAGASDDLARRASEEVAGYEHRLQGVTQKIEALDHKLDQRFADSAMRMAVRDANVERRFDATDAKIDQRYAGLDTKIDARAAALEARMDTRFTEVHGRINLMTWMVTFNLALSVLVIGKLFGVIG